MVVAGHEPQKSVVLCFAHAAGMVERGLVERGLVARGLVARGLVARIDMIGACACVDAIGAGDESFEPGKLHERSRPQAPSCVCPGWSRFFASQAGPSALCQKRVRCGANKRGAPLNIAHWWAGLFRTHPQYAVVVPRALLSPCLQQQCRG